MSIEAFALPSVILLVGTSVSILTGRNWRWSIGALACQYIGVFILVAAHWQIEMAVAKLVSGWMAGAVLGMAAGEAANLAPQELEGEEQFQPSGRIFRLIAASLIFLVVVSSAPQIAKWVPGADLYQSLGSLILIGIGLLQLGMSAQPLRVVMGLLTVLSGFEIIYASVESSALLAGLLAASTLALALIGAYLMVSPGLEDSE